MAETEPLDEPFELLILTVILSGCFCIFHLTLFVITLKQTKTFWKKPWYKHSTATRIVMCIFICQSFHGLNRGLLSHNLFFNFDDDNNSSSSLCFIDQILAEISRVTVLGLNCYLFVETLQSSIKKSHLEHSKLFLFVVKCFTIIPLVGIVLFWTFTTRPVLVPLKSKPSVGICDVTTDFDDPITIAIVMGFAMHTVIGQLTLLCLFLNKMRQLLKWKRGEYDKIGIELSIPTKLNTDAVIEEKIKKKKLEFLNKQMNSIGHAMSKHTIILTISVITTLFAFIALINNGDYIFLALHMIQSLFIYSMFPFGNNVYLFCCSICNQKCLKCFTQKTKKHIKVINVSQQPFAISESTTTTNVTMDTERSMASFHHQRENIMDDIICTHSRSQEE